MTIFGHFCRWGFFRKNQAVKQNYIWAPKAMLAFGKKLMSQQSQQNIRTDGRTDVRTDGKTLFHSTFPIKAGSPKIPNS